MVAVDLGVQDEVVKVIRPLLSGSRLGRAENEVLAVAYDRLQEVSAKRYPFVGKDRT